MIRITSKKAGFRRCGMPHPKEPVDYPDDRFSEEELDILMAEPMLIVELIESPVERMIPDESELEPEIEPESETEPELETETIKVLNIDDMTVAQIKCELDTLGIEYPDKARKAELFELYEGAHASQADGR